MIEIPGIEIVTSTYLGLWKVKSKVEVKEMPAKDILRRYIDDF